MCCGRDDPESLLIGDVQSPCVKTGDQITCVVKCIYDYRSTSLSRISVVDDERLDGLTAVTDNVDDTVQLGHSTHLVFHSIYRHNSAIVVVLILHRSLVNVTRLTITRLLLVLLLLLC